MAEAPRTKRPPGRTAQRAYKDPRIDSSPPVLDEEVQLGPRPSRPSSPRIPVASRPPAESIAMRVAALEDELGRLRAERAEEADQIADVLVRIADAERGRAAAEARVAELEEAARSLE